MKFLNVEHEKRFEELCKRGRCIAQSDVENKVVMFIIAGNKDLYDKSNELYDFNRQEFIFDLKEEDGKFKIVWRRPLSSSETKLITLAFDLFSFNNNVGVVELFNVLDSRNRDLALKAIEYRFS